MNERLFLGTFLGICSGVLLMTQPALANPDGTHGQGGGGKRIERLHDELGLSDDQTNKVAEIMASARGTCQSAADQDAKRACFQAARKNTSAQIEAVLTPDQLQKFETIKAQRREYHQQHPGWRKGADATTVPQ